MSRRFRRLAQVATLLAFMGWFTYPGYYYDWYWDWSQEYAYPASMSNQHDPHWGFWFW